MAEHKKSIGFEELIVHFEELEDPRSEINRKHPLVSVVVISLMGIPGGASGPTDILVACVVVGAAIGAALCLTAL